jgi:hypothetical protein
MTYKQLGHTSALLLARVVGLGAATTTVLLLYILLFANPYDQQGLTNGTYVVGGIMVALALLAAWGTLTLKPWALVLAFVASFFPVGFYLLGTPGIFALVGVANVLYLVAGALISFAQYRMRRSP